MDKDIIVLSKVIVSGKIDFNTPLCVLKDILKSYCFKIDADKLKSDERETVKHNGKIINIRVCDRYIRSMIKAINKTSPHVITFPIEEDAKKTIAKFFNCEIDDEKINNNLLMLYCAQRSVLYDKYKCCDISVSIKYGLILRNTSYDGFSQDISEDDINYIFKEYESEIKLVFIYKNKFVKLIDVIPINEDNLQIEYNKMQSSEIYDYKQNNISTIIYAMYTYRLDLTSCDSDVLLTINYKFMTTNPEKHIYTMTLRYNPLLKKFYTYDERRNFAYTFNVPMIDNIEMFWESIDMVILTEKTFYLPGEIYVDIDQNLKTISLDSMKEIPLNEIVYYGLWYTKELVPMSYEDLLMTFNVKGDFINPYTNIRSEFSLKSMKRLERICPNQQLRKKIKDIFTEKSFLTSEIEEFKNDVIDDTDKQFIYDYFIKFMELGFYMRSWDGQSNYPLSSEDTSVADQSLIDMRTGIQFEKLNDHLNTHENIDLKRKLYNLPIVSFNNQSKEFIIASGDGRETISGILDIVFSDRRNVEINSCIRMSSNYICITAHYYITTLFRKSPPFSIEQLKYIS